MAEPALKVETEFLRIAVEALEMRFGPDTVSGLLSRGLYLTDLHNALACCEVRRSNKLEADGTFFEVIGDTTEGITLNIKVWVSLDQRFYRIEEVS